MLFVRQKRVGLGEMLLSNARALFLDEVSTGLDAAVTLHFFRALQQCCSISRASVVTALLQPTPETYALFDEVLLLCQGHVVFHGRREDVPGWLCDVAGLELPAAADEAGFLVDFLTDPQAKYEAEAARMAKAAGAEAGTTGGEAAAGPKVLPVRSAAELRERYERSQYFTQLRAEVSSVDHSSAMLDPSRWSAYTRASFASRFAHSGLQHARHTLARQARLTLRNRNLVLRPRVGQALIMGLIFGSLFYNVRISLGKGSQHIETAPTTSFADWLLLVMIA